MRRPSGFAGWAAAILGALAACRADLEERTEVVLWAFGREGEVAERLVPEFERRFPELRVELQQIPWSAAHEKLLTAYVGQALPDVLQVGNTWIPELVTLGALEPLDGFVERSEAVSPEDHFPGILETNRLDGRLYGVPWYVDTRLLFYRADLAAAAGCSDPPRSWSQWKETLRALRRKAAPGDAAILLPLAEWQVPVILALQRGASLLRDDDTRGAFQEPQFREALAFYASLFEEGLAPRSGTSQVANLYQEFARGGFVFFVTGPWNLGEFARRLPAELQGAWATAPMPAPDPEDFPGASLAGGASLAIARGSPRKAAAWRLVEALTSPAAQLELYRLAGDLPARRSAWSSGALAQDPRTQAFWKQLERVKPTPKIPEWERIAETIGRYAEEVARARLGVDEALARLDADVDRILEKRRWLRGRGGRGSG
jgi:multiple sugar transport system substrate-binding protein